MKKLLIIIATTFSILLVSCGSDEIPSTVRPSSTFNADAFANDEFITYAANINYRKGNTYTLEFSVNIPGENGSSNKTVIKSSEFKAGVDTKILTDAVLISDIENIIHPQDKNSIIKWAYTYRDYEYTIFLYDSKDGKLGDGVATSIDFKEK